MEIKYSSFQNCMLRGQKQGRVAADLGALKELKCSSFWDWNVVNFGAVLRVGNELEMVTYLQPTNVMPERAFADPKKDQFSSRNVMPRIIFRSLSIVVARLATLLAAMLPFFGDVVALLGAFACIPLDFILPMKCVKIVMPTKEREECVGGENGLAVAMEEEKKKGEDMNRLCLTYGSWLQCAYDLVTAIVAPVLLSLPYVMPLLGWVGGVVYLIIVGPVTFYL
ncbi:hypothetical protein Vadar_000094 [Vaccinium darrowii]|uniref:Uncharacterized protein n=1 Tax=Vaccinium darrowii TaxID=229202 RepID=A0ACB7XEH4_9ERIC|nr:hypothetical protein Vadar_000094 [Vaccinium darrowii]